MNRTEAQARYEAAVIAMAGAKIKLTGTAKQKSFANEIIKKCFPIYAAVNDNIMVSKTESGRPVIEGEKTAEQMIAQMLKNYGDAGAVIDSFKRAFNKSNALDLALDHVGGDRAMKNFWML